MVLRKKPWRGGGGVMTSEQKTLGKHSRANAHLAALAGNAAIMVTCGLVATHHTRLILFEVAGYVPWGGGRV